MYLSVKAFLQKGDGKRDVEIRRFQIPADSTSSFAYLSRKLVDIFPYLKTGDNSVFWKDPEGDLVFISNDEELAEATGYVSDGVFRVYVSANDADISQDSGVHQENSCNMCEDKEGHVEHEGTESDVPAALPKSPEATTGKPHGPFVPPPNFRRWMKKFVKRWHERNVPGWTEGEKHGKEKEAAEVELESEKDKQRDDSDGDELLKRVGETKSAMLDDFGVDAETIEDTCKVVNETSDVETEAIGQGCTGRSGRGGHEKRGRGKRHLGCARGRQDTEDKNVECVIDQNAESAQSELKVKRKATGNGRVGQRGNGMERKVERKQNQGGGKCLKVNKESEKLLKAQNNDLGSQTERISDEALFGKSKPKVTLITNGKVMHKLQQLAPTDSKALPRSQRNQSADTQMDTSLKQIGAMGFTKDGRWLSRFQQRKNGDVIQVTDTIRTHHVRTNQEIPVA